MNLRVLIAVTHLLGAGHLTRAAALGRAFAARGHRVTLVSGGDPAPQIAYHGMDLVQLPPVRIKGTDFKTLLDENGNPANAERLALREARLLQIFKQIEPNVLITELFPFGRRPLRGELTTLLAAAHAMRPRPLIVSSIRDILGAPKTDRVVETQECLERFYDLVLVHGDAAFVPLDASWPMDRALLPLLRFTGYVDGGMAVTPSSGRRGILVSGGSSAGSLPLYRTAIEAARLVPDQPWRILVGLGVPDHAFDALSEKARDHLVIEHARPDFRALLSKAAVSVSQAGYNTVIDLLRARPPSILVPFEAGDETEQRLRAEHLRTCGFTLLAEADLSAQTLAAAARTALAQPSPLPASFPSLDGARRSVEIVEDAIACRPALHVRLDWSPVEEALRRARDLGDPPRFWWRDDDAVADTPTLRRLIAVAQRHHSPVAIACIPAKLQPSLLPVLAEAPFAEALVHGWAHANHAPEGEEKAEFGAHRPPIAMERELLHALHRAASVLGATLLPVFVPPWNRIAPDLVPSLGTAQYEGLSTFGDRSHAEPAPGLVQVNTHLDPIDWHGSRGLIEHGMLVATLSTAIRRRTGLAKAEPIGLLTHHLAHAETVWSFCEGLIELLKRNNVCFSPASDLFLKKTRPLRYNA